MQLPGEAHVMEDRNFHKVSVKAQYHWAPTIGLGSKPACCHFHPCSIGQVSHVNGAGHPLHSRGRSCKVTQHKVWTQGGGQTGNSDAIQHILDSIFPISHFSHRKVLVVTSEMISNYVKKKQVSLHCEPPTCLSLQNERRELMMFREAAVGWGLPALCSCLSTLGVINDPQPHPQHKVPSLLMTVQMGSPSVIVSRGYDNKSPPNGGT